MKLKVFNCVTLILVLCSTVIKSQEKCEDLNTELISIDGVLPQFIGEIYNISISDADSLTTSGNFMTYFSAKLEDDKISIFTTEKFKDYEKENSNTRPTLTLNIRCKSSHVFSPVVRISIAAVNNYAPEFPVQSFDIKIPTPIPKGFDLTSGLESQIIVIDYDLYYNDIKFSISGTDLFDVEAVLIEGIKPSYFARINSRQQIVKLENDQLEFTLTAEDSFDEPKSTSVEIRIYSDPEVLFIESPRFLQPMSRGTLFGNKTLVIDEILLDQATYDDNVEFLILNDEFKVFKISNEGSKIQISIAVEDLPNELLERSFVDFIIEAKREGDLSGFTAVIIQIPSVESVLSFSQPLYEGRIQQNASIDLPEIVLSDLENTKIELSGTHGEFFDYSSEQNIITLKLKSNLEMDQFLNEVYLQVLLTASKEKHQPATTNVILTVIKDLPEVSEFEKTLYLGEIDNQKVLKLENIQIKSTIQFETLKLAGSHSDYFSASIADNKVTLKLVEEITEDFIIQNQILSLELTAEHKDIFISTKIVLTLPRVSGDKVLRFGKSHYVGTIENLLLDVPEIILDLYNYDESVIFSISGNDKSFFGYERNENALELSLLPEITQEDLKNRVFLTVTISAARDGFVTAETVVFVHVNTLAEGVSPIEFSSPVYRGTLSYNNVLEIEGISIKSEEDDLQVTIEGEHAEKFSIQLVDSTEIEVNFKGQSIDLDQKFYYFYIEAQKFGAPKAYATVVIEIVDKNQLKFEELYYFGNLDEQQNLSIDEIPLNSALTASDVSFRLTEGQAGYFNFTLTSNTININRVIPILIQNANFFWFYLEAYGDGYYSARTLIVVGLPKEMDIPSDNCCAEQDPTEPYFEFRSYSFTFMNDEVGAIGKLNAKVDDPEESIEAYSLIYINNHLSRRVTITDGIISIIDPISTGLYELTGVAYSSSGKSAMANILFNVLDAKTCENEKSITTVKKVLVSAQIEENELYDNIFYTKIDDCQYEIEAVSPAPLRDYFDIDSNHNLFNSKHFDRESQYFANSSIAQVKVKLKLSCPSESINESSAVLSEALLTDEIFYSPFITYLNIEILDQNDNPPIFTKPQIENMDQIGVPDAELIKLFMPKYLYKVEAYDLDIGINAVIRYSISMPAIFEIDPVSGEIYALGTVDDQPSNLLITATDRDGSGLRTTISLGIVKVKKSDILEIIVDNYSVHDVDELAQKLALHSGVDIRVLSSAQLPLERKADSKQLESTIARSKIYIYGFQWNSKELVNPEELIANLTDFSSFTISYSLIEKCQEAQPDKIEDDCDYLIWILIVSVMATVILIILVAIPIIWFFVIKKKEDKMDISSASSKEEIADHFYESESRRRSSIIPADVVQYSREIRSSDEESVATENGEKIVPKTVNTEKLNNRLISYLDDDSPAHDRKVKFNELVEQIEVIEESDSEAPKDPELPETRRY